MGFGSRRRAGTARCASGRRAAATRCSSLFRSPLGRRVVTGSLEGIAQVWDSATGAPVGLPLRHHGSLEHVRFNRDGRWLATASRDYTARVWDAATGEPITPPLRHGPWLLDAEF